MKNADWLCSFWVKAAALLLAAALTLLAALSGTAILAATENGWWASRDPELFETDIVRSAAWRDLYNTRDTIEYFAAEGVGIDDALFSGVWTPNTDASNFRFAVVDQDYDEIWSNLDSDCYLLADMEAPLSGALSGGHVLGGIHRSLGAQDDVFWAYRAAEKLHGFYPHSIALLVGAALGLLLLVIYFARTAARRPGAEGFVPGWQEKIPFDLYLLIVGSGFALLFILLRDSELRYFELPVIVAAIALGLTAAAVLLLGMWTTLCARIKLGAWWRNTVLFFLCSLLWRVLRAIGRFCAAAVRAVPLIWRTGILCAAVSAWLLFAADQHAVFVMFLTLALLSAFALYVAWQLRRLQKAGQALAAGELDAKADTRGMLPDFRRHGENLNDISRGMSLAVEKQLKSERLKTELITNVSHDIKTPITSIINYVGLLQRDPTPEQREQYLEVLDRQSRKLKKLTEDLIEVSKASTGNLAVSLARTSMNELLLQALGEYNEKLDRAQLEAVLTLPERELFVMADGTLMWRVLDNLFSNACKYALPGTRFYVDAREADGTVRLLFRNVSREKLTASADELLERFVRGDSARGGEGSGLGLNIAKSLVELQGGTFALAVDGDLFKAEITFPSAP